MCKLSIKTELDLLTCNRSILAQAYYIRYGVGQSQPPDTLQPLLRVCHLGSRIFVVFQTGYSVYEASWELSVQQLEYVYVQTYFIGLSQATAKLQVPE